MRVERPSFQAARWPAAATLTIAAAPSSCVAPETREVGDGRDVAVAVLTDVCCCPDSVIIAALWRTVRFRFLAVFLIIFLIKKKYFFSLVELNTAVP